MLERGRHRLTDDISYSMRACVVQGYFYGDIERLCILRLTFEAFTAGRQFAPRDSHPPPDDAVSFFQLGAKGPNK